MAIHGEIRGIVSRQELKAALAANAAPRLTPPVLCTPDARVREVGKMLMESPLGMVLIREQSGEDISAVVTLHDLLRAQAALSE
jgi:CIC family chloride channel protein